jgi:hypothetical protein
MIEWSGPAGGRSVTGRVAAVSGLRARFGVWHDWGMSYLGRSGARQPAVCVGIGVVPAHATALGRARPEPLRWPVDSTAPTLSLVDATGSTA